MRKSISDIQKMKRRGRPKTTGTTPLTGVRLSEKTLAAITCWANQQVDRPSKAEAIRRLIDQALAESGPVRSPIQTMAQKAAELTKAIERMGDQSGTDDERAGRKRSIIRGPKEFREIRADLPKSPRRK